MKTMTIRLQDEKHDRLRALATHRGVSLNKLFEEFSTIALTEFDAEARFLARAKRADSKRG
ncbi:MAG: toxin-antitoxin system HicB family antitoxin [Rhodospirillales bacterium]